AWLGRVREHASPRRPPLRTGRDTCASSGSSPRLLRTPPAVHLLVAGMVQMAKVVLDIAPPCRQRHFMVGVQVLSVKHVLSADWTLPVLVDRDAKEFRAAYPVRLPIPSAPILPVVVKSRIIR